MSTLTYSEKTILSLALAKYFIYKSKKVKQVTKININFEELNLIIENFRNSLSHSKLICFDDSEEDKRTILKHLLSNSSDSVVVLKLKIIQSKDDLNVSNELIGILLDSILSKNHHLFSLIISKFQLICLDNKDCNISIVTICHESILQYLSFKTKYSHSYEEYATSLNKIGILISFMISTLSDVLSQLTVNVQDKESTDLYSWMLKFQGKFKTINHGCIRDDRLNLDSLQSMNFIEDPLIYISYENISQLIINSI